MKYLSCDADSLCKHFPPVFLCSCRERSLLDVRSMVCCALESVSVAPLLASWWTAAALRRAVGAIANRSMAVPRAGCSLLVSWALVEPTRTLLSNEVTVAYTLHDVVARYCSTAVILLHLASRQRVLRHHTQSCMCVSVCVRLAKLGLPAVSACSHRSGKLGDACMQTCVGA